MKVNIITRKYDPTSKMRDKMVEKLEKFDKFFGVDTEANIVLSKEKDREISEITIHFNETFFRVEETTKDMYTSFDECIENLKKQIRKYKTKLENKFKSKNMAEPVWFEPQEEEEKEFEIVKSKRVSVKPMFVEEAILQMNLLSHEFFVFLNAETNRVDVVYKRKDGNYGLIETQ